jgi:hypothetical protein
MNSSSQMLVVALHTRGRNGGVADGPVALPRLRPEMHVRLPSWGPECPNCGSLQVQFAVSMDELPNDHPPVREMKRFAHEDESYEELIVLLWILSDLHLERGWDLLPRTERPRFDIVDGVPVASSRRYDRSTDSFVYIRPGSLESEEE